MSEGQRKARNIQRGLAVVAIILMVGTTWAPEASFDRLMMASWVLIVASLLIDAMRALAEDFA